jgi:hypothetical protein
MLWFGVDWRAIGEGVDLDNVDVSPWFGWCVCCMFHCCLGPTGLFNFDEKDAFYMLILLTNKKRWNSSENSTEWEFHTIFNPLNLGWYSNILQDSRKELVHQNLLSNCWILGRTWTSLKIVQLVIQHILPVNFVSFVCKYIEIYFDQKAMLPFIHHSTSKCFMRSRKVTLLTWEASLRFCTTLSLQELKS